MPLSPASLTTRRIVLPQRLSSMTLAACGTIATTAAVGGAVVGVAGTAAGLAVDGAVLVGKGVVKTGEVAVDAMKGGT